MNYEEEEKGVPSAAKETGKEDGLKPQGELNSLPKDGESDESPLSFSSSLIESAKIAASIKDPNIDPDKPEGEINDFSDFAEEMERQTGGNITIEVAKPFRRVLQFKKRMVLIRSGRDGGKSTFVAQLAIALTTIFPNRDVIVCRDSYSDLEDTSYNELLGKIADYGLGKQYVSRKDPLRIENIRNGCCIYFKGVGGADTSRTRSIRTLHKVIAVIFEELQQVRDRDSLEQAQASFRRLMDTKRGMMIHLYNPMPSNSHWLNLYWNEKKKDRDWLCIQTSYLDVAKYLNDLDLSEILKMKISDFERYRWMYLGVTTGGFGTVYPEFVPQKHLLSFQQANERFTGLYVRGVIVGVDTAVTHDRIAYVPLLIMSNGQGIVRGKDIFVHDPITMGQMGSAELMPYVMRWFHKLDLFYNFRKNGIPVVFAVDPAGTELIRILRYQLPNWADVVPFRKRTISEMTDIVKNALSTNSVYLVDDGYHQTTLGERQMDNQLAKELQELQWKKKTDGSAPAEYDPGIRNDVSDAFTYAVNEWFKNPDNLYWLSRIHRKPLYDMDTLGLQPATASSR